MTGAGAAAETSGRARIGQWCSGRAGARMESTTREPFQALKHMMHGSVQLLHPAQVKPPRRKPNTCWSTASAFPRWRRSAPRALREPSIWPGQYLTTLTTLSDRSMDPPKVSSVEPFRHPTARKDGSSKMVRFITGHGRNMVRRPTPVHHHLAALGQPVH